MKRGRGRGGRKPSNNLNRTLESNGPDVKVRGTAHQICDKYQSLARDAHSSGDRIAHESYLQYAEHYHRIIAAAQPPVNQEAAKSHDETDANEDSVPDEARRADETADTNGAEAAPRRARRGRRGRSERSNGRSNGNNEEVSGEVEIAPTQAAPTEAVSSDDEEASAETA